MLVRGPGSAAGTKRPSTTERVRSAVLWNVAFWSGGGPAPRAPPGTLVPFRALLPTPQVLPLLPCQSRVGPGVWEGRRSGSGQHAVLMDNWPLSLPPPFHRWDLHHMPSLESMGDKEMPSLSGCACDSKNWSWRHIWGCSRLPQRRKPSGAPQESSGGPRSSGSLVPSTEQACSRR